MRRRRPVWTGSRGSMRLVNTPETTIDLVESQSPINSLPEIAVLYWDILSESLPAPTVLSPLAHPTVQALSDIGAIGDERDTRRLIEGFQSANHGEQRQAFAGHARLFIGGNQRTAACCRLENEPPVAHVIVGGFTRLVFVVLQRNSIFVR